MKNLVLFLLATFALSACGSVSTTGQSISSTGDSISSSSRATTNTSKSSTDEKGKDESWRYESAS